MGRNLERLKSLGWTILIAPLVLVVTGCGMETGAAPFAVNSHRIDPYKNFKFRVK